MSVLELTVVYIEHHSRKVVNPAILLLNFKKNQNGYNTKIYVDIVKNKLFFFTGNTKLNSNQEYVLIFPKQCYIESLFYHFQKYTIFSIFIKIYNICSLLVLFILLIPLILHMYPQLYKITYFIKLV